MVQKCEMAKISKNTHYADFFTHSSKKLGPKMKAAAAEITARSKDLGARHSAGDETFDIYLDAERILLTREDLLIESCFPDNSVLAEDGATWVSLDTMSTPDVRVEGMMRELLRRLQVQGKDEGLEIEDRINLVFETESDDIRAVFDRFTPFLKEELLALDIASGASDKAVVHEIADQNVRIQIQKA